MSLPDSSPDALPEGDLCQFPAPAPISVSSPPSPCRPDNFILVMVAARVSRRELSAEACGGIDGGFYGNEDEGGFPRRGRG